MSTTKRTRKLRRTNDLVFFESLLQQEDGISLNTNKATYFGKSEKISTLTSSPLSEITIESFSELKRNIRNSTSSAKNPSVDCTSSQKRNSLAPQSESSNDLTTDEGNIKKRKIVKARRLQKAQKENVLDELTAAKREEKLESCKFDDLKRDLKDNITVNAEATKEISLLNIEDFDNSDFFKVTRSKAISPSSGENNSPEPSHLHFDSSREDLHPSTNGIVETLKRRTYELEDSVTEISHLKSLSRRDSTRLSSFPRNDSSVKCVVTPPNNSYSKVTMRKKWNKCHDISDQIVFSPKWLDESRKSQRDFSVEKKMKVTPAVKKSSTKKFISRIKIPNFSAIHQKALDKVESISEYKQRKEQRARILLSGLKPKPSVEEMIEKTSKKQLRFAPNSTLNEKSPTFIPLPSTPAPKSGLKAKTDSPMTPPPTQKTAINPFNFNFVVKSKVASAAIPKQKPFARKNSPKLNPFNFVVKNKQTQLPTSRQNFLEKKIFALQNSNVQKILGDAQLNKIKTIVTKSKPTKSIRDSQRCVIKGVRGNRRFELLMNMRKGK